MVRRDMIVATTQRLEVYGGHQLTREDLEGLAASLRSGIPVLAQHDARRPIRTENQDAGVRQRDDGEYEVWLSMDVDEDDWSEYEADLAEAGATGGISYTSYHPVARAPGPEVGYTVQLAANAAHSTDEQILEAGEAFAGVAPIEVGRLLQFSFHPPDLVVLTFILNELRSVPAGVIGNFAYDALRKFRRGDATPELRLEVESPSGKVTAVIPEGTSNKVAKRAINAFENVASQPGLWVHPGTEDGDWEPGPGQ